MSGIDENTKVCYPFDSGFVDIVNSKNSYPKGSVVISSDQTKWESGAAYFNGSNSTNAIEIHETVQLPDTTDFTLDFQIFLTNRITQTEFFNLQSNSSNYWKFYLTTGNTLRFESKISGTTTVTLEASNSTLSTNNWHHLAIERYNNDFSIYIDGVQRATVNSSGSLFSQGFLRRILFGKNSADSSFQFAGYLDELRISNSARYQNVSSFTLPSAAYSETTISVSGNIEEDARVIILDETDMSIESNTEKSAGDFNVEVTDSKKTVIVRKSDGESMGYGNVSPVIS